MQASQRTIKEILTEEIRYGIPDYQRPYSWRQANVTDLLDDIWASYEANEAEYFIGSLITVEIEKGRLYEVVDGQQRLTTLNLILARIRNAVGEPARSALGQRVLPRDPLTDREESPRLIVRKSDRAFFRTYVLGDSPVTPELADEVLRRQDAPKQRFIENLQAVDGFVARHDENTLKKFANFLLSNVYVVFVTTDSLSSAHRLFNVLNARGLSLSNADLIKNRLFSRAGDDPAVAADINEAWLSLEEQIGIDRLDLFLGHHRTSEVAARTRKALSEEFEPLVSAAPSALAFLQGLNRSAENYLRVLDDVIGEPKENRALRSLRRVTFEEWIPPLLAFLNAPLPDMPRAEFIDLLERITYQNWVRRLGMTARLTVYFQLISAIRRREAADVVRSIFRAGARDEEFRTLLDGEVYGEPFAHAVLLRLEEGGQDESVTKDFGGKITIEHVMPQALKDPYWRERFDEETHRTWLHRLGNLALLAGGKNYRASARSFPEKKAIFGERLATVSFDTTKPILGEPEWGMAQLEARQRTLLDLAMGIWALEGR